MSGRSPQAHKQTPPPAISTRRHPNLPSPTSSLTVSLPVMRFTRVVWSVHPVTARPTLSYALGLSYAAKQSPPFVPASSPPPSAGFAGQKTPLGRWVDLMKSLPAGRGMLRESHREGESEEDSDGGWGIDTAWQVRKWGAGEDFFAVVDGGAFVSEAAWVHCRLAILPA